MVRARVRARIRVRVRVRVKDMVGGIPLGLHGNRVRCAPPPTLENQVSFAWAVEDIGLWALVRGMVGVGLWLGKAPVCG